MGFISLAEDVIDEKIVDEEGNSATFRIKRVLSKGDINYALETTMDATRDMGRSDRPLPAIEEGKIPQQLGIEMVLGLPVGQLAILKRAIVGWDLKYPKGHPDSPAPIELSEENIELLASSVVDQLCDVIKELNHVKTKEELVNLEKT